MSWILSKLINLAGNITGTLPISNGGTSVTSVTTSPTASAFAGWDANKNLSANSLIEGYTTTATAASTTTLTVASTFLQFFTGSTTQTVILPVTSTLVLGQQFQIINNSTGIVTVQSSGANTIQAMGAGTAAIYTCILTTGTTAASWAFVYNSGALVSQNSPGLVASAGQLLGISSNTVASAGNVGETMTITRARASPTTLSNNTPVNVCNSAATSITLTAGDWDVRAMADFTPGSVTTEFDLAISQTSATLPSANVIALPTNGECWTSFSLAYPSGPDEVFCIAPYQVTVATTLTLYLVARASFITGTAPTVYGWFQARRMR